MHVIEDIITKDNYSISADQEKKAKTVATFGARGREEKKKGKLEQQQGVWQQQQKMKQARGKEKNTTCQATYKKEKG